MKQNTSKYTPIYNLIHCLGNILDTGKNSLCSHQYNTTANDKQDAEVKQ